MPLTNLDLAIVDIETTGIAAHYHRVIEIAILRVKDGQLLETFSTLVDPERAIPHFIEGLTGIRNRDLERAPTFSQVKDRLFELLDGAIFVAHNARFDYTFLKEEFEREKMNYAAKCLCTMRLSRALFPEHRKHSLDSIMDRFGIACANRHRAAGDALVLWDFLQILQERISGQDLGKALSRILKTPALPPFLDERLLKSLPATPGVYVFYDRNGEPLYVGKSVNIRNRVLSHFSGDLESAREQALRRQVADVQAIQTSRELGALLLESHLVKQLSPLYNRRARIARKLVVMKRGKNDTEYATVKVGYLDKIIASDLPHVVGIFKSMKQAREFLWNAAREHALCPRILGLEKGKGACTHLQLKKCNGACRGSESAIEYNDRFAMAFSGRRVTPWPFPGPILIEETDETGRQGEYFIVDKWCLIDCFRFDESGKQRLMQGDYSFDYDGYKILHDQLLKSRKRVQLKHLTDTELTSLLEGP
jgi:DNA polymerase-3 subunit epsilon